MSSEPAGPTWHQPPAGDGELSQAACDPVQPRQGDRPETRLPVIIQGGMGVGVSGWRLGRAVALAGQLGVVSGLGLDILLARRLQLGDPEDHLRRALARFPFPAVAEQIVDRYFVDGGIDPEAPSARCRDLRCARAGTAPNSPSPPTSSRSSSPRRGTAGSSASTSSRRSRSPTPASRLRRDARGRRLRTDGRRLPNRDPRPPRRLRGGTAGRRDDHDPGRRGAGHHRLSLDPGALRGPRPNSHDPKFLAIISSTMLAIYLAREVTDASDGFVVEGLAAGGHNARPRGPLHPGQAGRAGLRRPAMWST